MPLSTELRGWASTLLSLVVAVAALEFLTGIESTYVHQLHRSLSGHALFYRAHAYMRIANSLLYEITPKSGTCSMRAGSVTVHVRLT